VTAQSLPPRPDLDQLKRQAKELLRRQPLLGRLRDAQRAIAQQYGFVSWDALRTHVESIISSFSNERVAAQRGLTYDDTLPGTLTSVPVITPDSVRQLKERNVGGVRIEQSVSPQTLALLAQIPTLHRLDLSGRADLVDRDLAFLEAMPWVTAVSFARCLSIGDDGVAYLRNHQHLEEVNLQWSGTGDGAVSHLAGKPRLHRVALGARLTDAGVARLRELPALRTPGAADSFLAISSSTALTDRSLAAVGDLAGVVSLDVHYSVFGSRKYTEAGVAYLQRMISLEELNFLGDLATDGVLREIASIPRLRRLSCQDMIAGDDGFRALARCSTLESIWGRHCHRVGDRGFEALAELPRLRSLALGGRRVSDAAMAALIDSPELTDLQPVMFGDEAFGFIARIPRLVTLTNMYNRSTTDAATRHLRGHPRLVRYGAHGTQIGDESLRILADLPAIERLEFVNCDRITDEGLLELARAPRLRYISVGSCPRVTGRWVEAFEEIETAFDAAQPAYIEQYRFWTLLDYPDLVVSDIVAVPREAGAAPLLSNAWLLGCRAEWRPDGLHLTANAGQRLDRVGVVTREAVDVPARIRLVAQPIEEVRLHLGRAQLVFDKDGTVETPAHWPTPLEPGTGEPHTGGAADGGDAGAATVITVEIEPTEARLFVNGVLRHTWEGDFANWRSRIAVGPRRAQVVVRELEAASLMQHG
jgi:hypothetical protein